MADAAKKWTPEREVINVFLELYLMAAYETEADTEPSSPFDDPADVALFAEVTRLHEFLSTEQFSSALLVMASGFTIADESLRIDTDVEVVPFSTKWRDELWAAAGWGSTAAQPLQSHEFFGVTHGISVTLSGPREGWSLGRWGDAQRQAERVRVALLLCGARTVTLGISWLSHEERFAPYLGRLRAGN